MSQAKKIQKGHNINTKKNDSNTAPFEDSKKF